jgi:uncharacterized DUF497 family protein
MVVVRFEWDPGKSSRNLLARRFDFEFAAGIFEGRISSESTIGGTTENDASSPLESWMG